MNVCVVIVSVSGLPCAMSCEHRAREALDRVLDEERHGRPVDVGLLREGLIGEIGDRYLRLLERELEEDLHLRGVLGERHPLGDERLQLRWDRRRRSPLRRPSAGARRGGFSPSRRRPRGERRRMAGRHRRVRPPCPSTAPRGRPRCTRQRSRLRRRRGSRQGSGFGVTRGAPGVRPGASKPRTLARERRSLDFAGVFGPEGWT